ncbi:MAG: hypothetical protein WCD13_02780, partial [Pseudolabrys sp.]
FFTLGEQLILQLSVTQSNRPSLLAVVLGAAAALAAGEDGGTLEGVEAKGGALSCGADLGSS